MFGLGEDEGPYQGKHAMMVVGIVGDTLLVQNWWRKAPFVQMSIDYLDKRGGGLSALPVGYREHKVPIGNSGRVMEAELNDVGERYRRAHHGGSSTLKGVRWQDGKMVMEFDQAGRVV